MKTHWKKTFNKEFLGSHDFDEGENEKNVVISRVEIKETIGSDGKKGKSNVAYFKGNLKPMILNVTNCKVLRSITGSNYIEEWKEINVTIFIQSVRAFGENTEGLRLKPFKAKQKPSLAIGTKDYDNCVKGLKEGYTIDQIKGKFIISNEVQSKLMEDAI